MDEIIIEVVPVTWRKSLFKSEPWAMIITNERLIFAKWTQELFNKEAQKRKEQTKEEGEGKLKQFLSQLSASFSYYDKYYQMQPEEIGHEHPDNFSIYSKDVTDIRLRKGTVRGGKTSRINVKINVGSNEVEDLETPHELTMTVNGQKIVFQFNKNFEEVKQALSGLFKF
ncbi:hypothetical protein [Caldisericum exile]|uniref:Uncharacterized protein n=1 Tax=Caldisericum exile (strain DSM 21853 / NBRC 104410 / AZM16c01) TaxID=511051 RepID=A0A7U6GD48_CALEA|nr:hypothetical protein [Caldisericum exile]BAL80146.1 hypothetical protein CSE_00200 [Caldisericum exile AZM16c01]